MFIIFKDSKEREEYKIRNGGVDEGEEGEQGGGHEQVEESVTEMHNREEEEPEERTGIAGQRV